MIICLRFSDRSVARRFCAAVDRHSTIDLPRTHTREEPAVSIGGRVTVPPYTETKCKLMFDSTTQAAVFVDNSIDTLDGQVVNVSDGGLRLITIRTSGPGIIRESLPPGWPTTPLGTNPWVERPPRDGLPGTR